MEKKHLLASVLKIVIRHVKLALIMEIILITIVNPAQQSIHIILLTIAII